MLFLTLYKKFTCKFITQYIKNMLFESFEEWKNYCLSNNVPLYESVLRFEQKQKNSERDQIWLGIAHAYQVMKEAVVTGTKENLHSRSGLVKGGGKKVLNSNIVVLSKEFQKLIARSLAAKELNACMGRVIAAPTAGASGILPGVLVTLQEIHQLTDQKIYEALLVSAGVALIIEKKASIAGAVGGCQAETGTAAAMASAAIVYALKGDINQVFNAVAVTIQCMLGLVCDPVAGLVEIPCVVRNASAAAIANSSAQIALSGIDAVIPVDECIEAMGEIGQNMEDRYKETAQGGLAMTKTGQALAKKILIRDIRRVDKEEHI